MPLRKIPEGYVCPLDILKNAYLENFDAGDNPVVLGSCGMCRFGDRSGGTKLSEMCQAPIGITFEKSQELLEEFKQKYHEKTGECLNLNDHEHRRAYWVFIRGRFLG